MKHVTRHETLEIPLRLPSNIGRRNLSQGSELSVLAWSKANKQLELRVFLRTTCGLMLPILHGHNQTPKVQTFLRYVLSLYRYPFSEESTPRRIDELDFDGAGGRGRSRLGRRRSSFWLRMAQVFRADGCQDGYLSNLLSRLLLKQNLLILGRVCEPSVNHLLNYPGHVRQGQAVKEHG